jgi:hypothetical protein
MSDTFDDGPPTHGGQYAYLDWRHLGRAVLAVFRENKGQEAASGVKASADTWGIASVLRQDLLRRVRDRWCHATGLDRFRFPYSEDEVVRFYFRYRKRKPEELVAFEAVLGAEG